MFARRNNRRPSLRRAAVITQAVIFGGTVGIGVAALAVDTGLMFAAKSQLQSAADSAALAAASQLGSSEAACALSLAEAKIYANLNEVAGVDASVVDSDVTFGHAVLNGEKYDFHVNQQPFDAVHVKLRRDQTVSDGPISLVFGRALGMNTAGIQAAATAMLVPRDIGVAIDLSGSMNDDSELRHSKTFPSEIPDQPDRPAVQINLRDVWCALNGPSPDHPYMPGLPTETQYSGDTGPTWGLMTDWGSQIVLGNYDASSDPGLLYMKKSLSITGGNVQSQLVDRGYRTEDSSSPSTMSEVHCLWKGTKDMSYSHNFLNRAKVILGIAEWQSGKSNSKYGHHVGGDGDDFVEDNELTEQIPYPSGMSGGTWDDYVATYVPSITMMSLTDASLRYRYGLKTFVNYLLEKRANHTATPQLASAPELPMTSVKDAVQTLVNTIVDLETQDHCSLEVFAATGHHEVNLSIPTAGQTLADALQAVPDTLYQRQAGYYDSTTCIGCGLEKAYDELTSARARVAAAKVIILLSDGKPNVGDDDMSPEEYAVNLAHTVADAGMTIYTVGVGGDANDGFLEQIAEIGHGEYFFADNAPDPDTGVPQYVEKLQQIFRELGGKRPVRLIQ